MQTKVYYSLESTVLVITCYMYSGTGIRMVHTAVTNTNTSDILLFFTSTVCGMIIRTRLLLGTGSTGNIMLNSIGSTNCTVPVLEYRTVQFGSENSDSRSRR